MNFVLFMQEIFIVTFYLKRTEDEDDVVPGYLGATSLYNSITSSA